MGPGRSGGGQRAAIADLAGVLDELSHTVARLADAQAEVDDRDTWGRARADALRLAGRARQVAHLARLRLDAPAEWLVDTSLVSVGCDVSLSTVAQVLENESVSAVLVEADSVPVGILTEHDVARAVARGGDPASLTAEQAMSGQLVSAPPETPIAEALALMVQHGVRHLPLRRGDELVGVVSASDLLRLFLYRLT